MMKNLGDMMRKAQEMQQKMGQIQEQILQITAEGQAGGGMVRVTMKGQGGLEKVTIDPTLVNPQEIDVLEDLIVAAVNDARQKLDAKSAEMMQQVTGGLSLPAGFKMPF
jgi:DNA-binding YbaB/EbfC family protein